VARELAAAHASDRLASSLPGAAPWLPTSVVRAYLRHSWPGNVRELANVARRLAVIGRDGPIAVDDALAPIRAPLAEPEPTQVARTIGDDELIAALARHHWRTGAAAEALGISRTTLYTLIDRCSRLRKARDLDRDEIAACRLATAGDLDRMSEQLQVSKRGLQLRMRELGM